MTKLKSSQKKKSKIIAVTGKGGSGKTVIAATMAGILSKQEKFSILAIDADSAACLPAALGMEIKRTVGDVREEIIDDPSAKVRMDDVPMRSIIAEVMEHGDGFDLLVMGRPEGPGCFCAVNDLLKYGIESLSKNYDITLIDCEAGPEQVNRRVVQSVDTLVIVTDTSVRGIHNAKLIKQITEKSENTKDTEMGLVINRLKNKNDPIIETAKQTGLKIFGCIPEDENITKFDSVGKPIINLPEESPGVVSVRKILREIGL